MEFGQNRERPIQVSPKEIKEFVKELQKKNPLIQIKAKLKEVLYFKSYGELIGTCGFISLRGVKMELVFMSLFCLFVLYFIIKTAVSKGIDDSRSIKEMKNEIRELKKQVKSNERNEEEVKHIINRKV